MEIELGYACINTELGGFRSYRLSDLKKPYKTEELKNRIRYNFKKTLEILKYNNKNNIRLYRITSNLIPLSTHIDFFKWMNKNKWIWWEDLEIMEKMVDIKSFVENNNIYVTMHPGQYTVLNSNKQTIVNKAKQDLKYHYHLITHMGGKGIVIHVGGVYGNKQASIKRWIKNYNALPEPLKDLILLENDDKSYTLEDTLFISKETGVTPIIDFHHHRCKPSPNLKEMVKEVIKIWGDEIKVHLSSGKSSEKDRSHTDLVTKNDYNKVINLFKEIKYEGKLRIMLECKNKEQAIYKLPEGIIK